MANRFLTIDDLTHQLPPTWLIDGLFEANSLVMLAGPSGSYKSFLALDWQLCLATDRRWNGKKVVPSKVLYVLGEGKSNLLKRIQTWMHYNNITDTDTELLAQNFRVCFDVPQMAMKASVDNMLVSLEQEHFQPNVICIDTFARSFVGLDENSQKDTGLWIEQADRLRQLGYTVLFLHHTAKNTEFGVKYRGSTAILGAMDTAITMVRDAPTSDRVTVMVTKQKDHDEGKPMHFRRLQICPPGSHESSIILAPAVQMDERFTDENLSIERRIRDLLSTPYDNDAARARVLAKEFNLSDNAASIRITRLKKEIAERGDWKID